ncbi:DUF6034 family protein [Bacillus niameyensis]|uniref:DUF6034 family protein n=1 Tax=Bacillus niameyensis TaxID=1522308 RepID=UPI0007850CCC|nr:DUF6034 family protein [Bacillus niameyensis]
MKKKLITSIITVTFLAGCQATPENPVVIQKDTEQMVNVAKTNQNNKKLTEMLNAPATLQTSVTDKSGNVVVNANAEVVVPDVEGIPTVRVAKHPFTQEEANKILDYFIGDNELIDENSIFSTTYTEQLIQWKAELAQEKNEAKRDQLAMNIEKLEEMGITETPKEVTSVAKTFEQDEMGGESIKGISHHNSNYNYIEIINNPAENNYRVFYSKEQKGYAISEGYYFNEGLKINFEKSGLDSAIMKQLTLSLTKEEAIELATDLISQLGIQDMVLSSFEMVSGSATLQGGPVDTQERKAYRLEYVRSINGIPITFTSNGVETDYETDNTTGEKVAVGWPNETVHFIIDDTGIVEFSWLSPYELGETVTENTTVKSFADIQDVFEKMSLITHAYPGEDGAKTTLDISKAQLGLMRINEKNNSDTALLIPVWDYFGTLTYDNEDDEPYIDTDLLNSRLTINAIDGSIINRRLGY